MASHTAIARLLALLVVVPVFQVPAYATGAASPPGATATHGRVHRVVPAAEIAAPSDLPDERIDVSLTPHVTIRGGTAEQRERLELALERFGDAGLMLPDLEVVFDPTKASCNGFRGLFQTGSSPWTISICSEAEWVYEHELAHAWEAVALTDEAREEFMALRGYTVWSDPAVPWDERGVEDAVFIIQQGLSGLPLPPSLGDEQLSRLAAFEFLTGFADPRIVEREATLGNTVISRVQDRALPEVRSAQ